MNIRHGFCGINRFTMAVATIGVLSCSGPLHAQTWVNANTSQFTGLALNTPTAVNFLGTGDLTMKRTSVIGSPIVAGTWNGTFTTPVGGEPNPDWVLGTRSYFELDCVTTGSAQSKVSYEFQYSGGLPINTKLVFIDLDWSEQVAIKAYDASNTLIPFANTSVLFSPGGDATPRYQDISWAASSGATGLLRNTFNDSESNIIASISSAAAIHRLVYDFDFSQVDNSGATMRFQLAAVPEP
ncbi:MAG: hypothetical protein ACKO4Z_15230, partial [Planctomycetota bacterium]